MKLCNHIIVSTLFLSSSFVPLVLVHLVSLCTRLLTNWMQEKSAKKTGKSFGGWGTTNSRWFTVEKAACIAGGSSKGSDGELAMCYYKSQTSSEPCGWIFLSDIEAVKQDPISCWLTICHPSRTYRIQAPERHQHQRWFSALSILCSSNAIEGQKEASHNMSLQIFESEAFVDYAGVYFGEY